jgi:DNA primase
VLAGHDLNTNEGRLAALDEAAPIIAGIRDEGLRKRYAINLDKWLGFLDEAFILNRIGEHMRRRSGPPSPRTSSRPPAPGAIELPGLATAGVPPPDPHDPALSVERGALKVVLQAPQLAGSVFDELDPEVFTSAAYAQVHAAVVAAGGATSPAAVAGGAAWVASVEEHAADDGVRRLLRELAVEPIPTDDQAQARYAVEVLARLEELAAVRRIAELKSRLQRLNPVEQQSAYNRLFGELIAFEQQRRSLRDRAIGAL